MDKKQLKKAFSEAMALNLVLAVKVGDIGFYVKKYTVSEMNQIIARDASLREQYADYQDERAFALEVFDKDGKEVFNPADTEDMVLIGEMPYGIRAEISRKSREINGVGKD